MIQLKRVYESYEPRDGYRILIDRLWPRGLKKEDAHIDLWVKDIAPSPALRKWFNHEPEKWAAFSKAYRAELKQTGLADTLVASVRKEGKVTFLYAAKDSKHTHALVLLAFINKRLK